MRDALFHLRMRGADGGLFESNDKATFYTDTEKSPFLRGRRSIVPYVFSIVLECCTNSRVCVCVFFFRCANILGGGSR